MSLTTIMVNIISFLTDKRLVIGFMLLSFLLITYGLFSWHGADDKKQTMQRYVHWFAGVCLFMATPRIAGKLLAPDLLAALDAKNAQSTSSLKTSTTRSDSQVVETTNSDNLYQELNQATEHYNDAKENYISIITGEDGLYHSDSEIEAAQQRLIEATTEMEVSNSAFEIQFGIENGLNSNIGESGKMTDDQKSYVSSFSKLTSSEQAAVYERITDEAKETMIELIEQKKREEELEELLKQQEELEKLIQGGTGNTGN